MPRTSLPTNLPNPQPIISIKQDIESKGWQTVRDSVVFLYKQRLGEIEQKRGQLSEEEFKKKRFKRLSEQEIMTLALCFFSRLIELNQNGTDTEDAIATLCEAETALLEQGYPKETIAKNHHGVYLNLIRGATLNGQLPLTSQNSYSFDIIKQDTGQKETIQQHYAQLYLKYDPEDYLTFKKDGKGRNNIKQDKPQPIILFKYLDKVSELLQSDSYTELAVGIAAATGRRFSEVMQRGTISIPENPKSDYEFLFEGQLKKNQPSAYLTYSLVPSRVVVDAIACFRELPKIKELVGASIKKINTVTNPTVNYQVRRHFQETGIMTVLESEQAVTVQNLRSAYGAIATHFFCPTLAQFPRFLSSSLGHLIGSETIDRSLSSSTEHYFHYYLVNGNGERITELGVKLDETSSVAVLLSDTAKTKTTTLNQVNETNCLKVAINLLQSEQLWAKVTGLIAVTGLLPNLLLHQLIFKEIKNDRTILYRDQVHSLNQPLNRLVTLFDAQNVMATIAQLRELPEIQSLTQTKTGNEFNAYVARQVKEHLTVLDVDSFDQLIERYQSFLLGKKLDKIGQPSTIQINHETKGSHSKGCPILSEFSESPSAPNSDQEEIKVKDAPALIHTFASTNAEFEQLMAQLGTETQQETLIKLLQLANVALAKESEPEQLAFVTEKDLEIAQLKEILITKDKEINRLNKAVASHDSELAQLQSQLTATENIKDEQETALLQAHQAHQKLSTQTDQLQDEVQRLCNVLQEKELAIATLQTALADSSQLITELQTTQTQKPDEPTEPLSESAQLTEAMITLTGVISQLTQQFSPPLQRSRINRDLVNPETTTQNLSISQSKKPSVSTTADQPQRSRSGTSERIEKAIAYLMQHNLNSPHSQRWLISYTVLADLLGISLTPITTFFNDQKNQQLVKAIAQHHQDLGLTNNTHNRTYHPKQKITKVLKLPD
jgi:hypothetical protein